MRDTDRDWRRIAETTPYWGVLSTDKFRGKELSKPAEVEFFESGERFVADTLGLINRHLVDVPISGRALDFGCGVGRLSIPLARYFRAVVGADIAEGMLALARQHASAAGLKNADFILADDDLVALEGSFDLINSFIVLQHIPPDRGYRFLVKLIGLARIGGVCSLQLTYARERRFLEHEAPRAAYYRRAGRTMIDVLDLPNSPPEGTVTMYDYDLNEVYAIISRFCGHPVLSLPTHDDGHLGVHIIFVRAR